MTAQLLTPTFDQDKADAFAEQLLAMFNGGALSLMISIGHRTGLFDVMATLPPSTSQQIADAAQLQERYVREWLHALVAGRMIEYDSAHQTYHLPAEHAAMLTHAAGADNMAVFFQHIASLGNVEDQIVDCFAQGGGVAYAEYRRFHRIMAEDSSQTIVAALEDAILPLVPGLLEKLQTGIDVLDVGCGCGYAMNKLARLFPNSRFTGYDISEEAIATAQAEAQTHQTPNVQFQVKDATTLNEVAQYDLITTFDAVHDQARPDIVLRNIYNALRPDGTYLMQDIHATTDVSGNLDNPFAPFLYTISCLHCMTVSLAVGGLGLGTMWGQEKAQELLQAAGFKHIEITQLPHDVMNDYYIIHK